MVENQFVSGYCTRALQRISEGIVIAVTWI